MRIYRMLIVVSFAARIQLILVPEDLRSFDSDAAVASVVVVQHGLCDGGNNR